MERTRIGVIGCGYWGPNLIRNFVEIPTTTLEAVSDLDPARRQHIRERYPQVGCVTEDYRDLFDLDLDGVVICTPPETHFGIIRECLRNGLHVLAEKPLVTRADDARELITLADEQQLALMVGHTFEYNAAVHALRELIKSGELGDVLYIDAVRVGLGLFHPRLNVIWDLAPHDISIASHVLGARPVSVAAQGLACLNGTIEDVAYLSVEFPGDVRCHMRVSWLDPSKTRRLTVVGTKKMAVYDDVESLEKLKIYDKRVDSVRRTDTFGEFQFAYHYGSVVSPHIHFEEPLRLECLHFLECIREGRRPLTDGNNGLVVVETIEAAQRSLRSGGVVVQVGSGQPGDDQHIGVAPHDPIAVITDDVVAVG